MNIDLTDKELFGNDAGEDEKIEILNSYYIENPKLKDFFDQRNSLAVVRARKGMGKSAMISRMASSLLGDEKNIVIRVTGNSLLGLGDFNAKDPAYLENYWKQIICKRVIIEIGSKINMALGSNAISMVEMAEIEGIKEKNFIGGLISRISGKIPLLDVATKENIPSNAKSILKNYQDKNLQSTVWVLVDDIDAKYKDNQEYQDRIGAFFSAIRSLCTEMKSLKIRASVRSDVWANLRNIEDLDKWEQYIGEITWTKRQLREMLANRILSYIKRNHPDTPSAKLNHASDYNKIFSLLFETPIQWKDKNDASIFDAIYSFSNKRPRWMGQLCRLSANKSAEYPQKNQHQKKISLDHINQILSIYGKNRCDDIIKEHQHQFSELSFLIDAFRANQKTYTREWLLKIIDDKVIKGRPNESIPEVDGHPYTSLEDLGKLAFKVGLISKMHDDGKTFTHYTDDPDIFGSNDNQNNKIVWSVHIAYRSYLGIH